MEKNRSCACKGGAPTSLSLRMSKNRNVGLRASSSSRHCGVRGPGALEWRVRWAFPYIFTHRRRAHSAGHRRCVKRVQDVNIPGGLLGSQILDATGFSAHLSRSLNTMLIAESRPVRNGVAARMLQCCDFACICSRIDRAVTDKESIAWLQKPVRDLPTECVAYTCTKAEDIARTCADAGAGEDNGRRGVRNNYDEG